MNRSFLALALLLSTLFGCASPTGAPGAMHEDVGAESSAERASTTYPPRVEHAIGATHEEICGGDDAQSGGAFEAYRQAQGQPLGTWVMEGEVRTCRFCNLDGQTISSPTGRVRIENSTAKNATFAGTDFVHSTELDLQLENVYAPHAAFSNYVNASLVNVDLRCATGAPETYATFGLLNHPPFETVVHDVDLSGSTGLDLQLLTDVADVRLTGAELTSLFFNGGTVAGARLDNVTITGTHRFDGFFFSPFTATGALVFDRSPSLKVDIAGKLDGATLSLGGARGTLSVSRKDLDLKNVTLVGNDGGVRLGGELGRVHVSGVWPVGKTGLVSDAELAALDLTGTTLTPAKGETWPAAPVVLDGLRLSHGAFPAGTDLTQVSLVGAKLDRVRFTEVIVSKMDHQVAVGVDLSNASLEQARFDQASIEGVSFRGADVRGASFAFAKGAARFDHAKASRLPAHTDDNDSDTAKDTSFVSADLGASRFDGAQLQSANLHSADLVDVSFEGAIADWASFADAKFFRSTADGKGIANVTLATAAGLHGAIFDGADMRGVSLAKADLTPSAGQVSSFVGTFLCGADLSGTKLGGANLSGAFADVAGTVTFPDGSTGSCNAGPREGVDTSSFGASVTACPVRGEAPNAASGQCSDAQWRVQGSAPTCTGPQRMNGAPCAADCDCQSLSCSAEGKCVDGK